MPSPPLHVWVPWSRLFRKFMPSAEIMPALTGRQASTAARSCTTSNEAAVVFSPSVGQPPGCCHFTVTMTAAECAVAPDVAVRLIVDVVPLLLPPLQEANAKTSKSKAKIPAKLNRRG
jgi:hypothetical protein